MDGLELDPGLLPRGSSILHLAANNRDTTQLSTLLQDQQLLPAINKPDSHGRTPLGVALQYGWTEAAVLLFNSGAELPGNISNSDNEENLTTLLERPVYHSLLRILIKHGANFANNAPFLQILLHSAAYGGDDSLLFPLLENYKMEVDCLDHLGYSALHYACLKGHAQLAQLLLDYGASATVYDPMGRTVVHLACEYGHVRILETLVGSCPDLDKVMGMMDSVGRTCAHVALYSKQFDCLVYILQNCRDCLDFEAVDYDGHSLAGLLFYFRIQLGFVPHDAWLSLPYLSAEESTWALHYSIHTHDMPLLQYTLASGQAGVDTFDFMNLTPLMLASSLGYTDMCGALVESGVQLNLADDHRITALHLACQNGQIQVAEYLLSLQGIDPTLFYETFHQPLSLPLLELILGYLTTATAAKKPIHWQKWLSLAVGNTKVTQVDLSRLVNKICPYCWLNLLAEGRYEYRPVSFKQEPASYLSMYVEEPSEQWIKNPTREAFERKKEKVKNMPSFSTKVKKPILPKKTFRFRLSPTLKVELGPQRHSSVMKFKEPLVSLKLPRKFKRRRPLGVYFPIHEAAQTRNASALTFFFAEAKVESRALAKKVLLDVMDESKQTVAELILKNLPQLARKLELLTLDWMEQKWSCFRLPGSMSYKEAFLHYLVVSRTPAEVVHHPSSMSFKRSIWSHLPQKMITPLEKWPIWYHNFLFFHHISKSGLVPGGIESVDEISLDQRKMLMEKLLERYGLPGEEVFFKVGYPSLLIAAVQCRCVWGVELLVRYGASPLASYTYASQSLRFPLSEAARTGQTDLLDHLLPVDVKESFRSDHQLALCPGLLVLAANSHRSWAETIYGYVRQKPDVFWTYGFGPRLIYLSFSQGWYSFSSQLVRDMVATVCHFLLFYPSDSKSRLWRTIHLFISMGNMLMKAPQRESFKEIQLAHRLLSCVVEQSYYKMQSRVCSTSNEITNKYFFHYLCGTGRCEYIQFILDVLPAKDREKLFLLHDSYQRSPLFYAAMNGHVEIVKRLVESGYLSVHGESNFYPDLYAAALHLNAATRKVVTGITYVTEIYQFCYNPKLIQFFASERAFYVHLSVRNFLGILSKLSVLPKLDLALPLLRGFLDHVEVWESDIRNSSSNGGTEEFSLLKDLAGEILRLSDSLTVVYHESVDTLDTILSRIISWELKWTEVVSASRKGLWRVALKSLESVMHNDKALTQILKAALEQEKFDHFSLISTVLTREGTFLLQGLPDLLSTAAKHGSTEAVELLLKFKHTEADLMPSLSLAVRFHSNSISDTLLAKMPTMSPSHLHEILQTSARCNNHHIIQMLLEAYLLNTLSSSLPPFGDQNLSFWFLVLTEAAKHGHEDLALQAIACLSESQLEKAKGETDAYLHILSWCCCWGMRKALEYLPYTSTMFLESPSDLPAGYCPLLCAMANGNAGKLSHLARFPSLMLKGSPFERIISALDINVMIGLFNKIAGSNEVSKACHDINCHPPCCDSFLLRAAYLGLTDVVEKLFEHLGKMAQYPQLIDSQHDNFVCSLLECACKRKNNLPMVQLILNHIFELKIPFNACDRCLDALGDVECVRSIVDCMPKYDNNFHRFLMQTFNHAVLSNNPQVVDYYINLLGKDAPSCCFKKYPPFSVSPFEIAFNFGCSEVILNSSLLTVALKVDGYSLSSWGSLSSPCGWFHLMMTSHAKAISPSGDLNANSEGSLCSVITPVRISLRKEIETVFLLLSLLHASVENRMESMTDAIIRACGGIIPHRASKKMLEVVAEILLSETVQNCMRSYSHGKKLLLLFEASFAQHGVIPKLLAKLSHCCGNEDKIVQVLDLFKHLCMDQDTCASTFISACWFGKSIVVDHLLPFIQDEVTITQGLSAATNSGQLGLVADLMLKLNLTNASLEISQNNPLLDLIFSRSSYYKILNKFYESLINPTQRMPLAAVWLVHPWSEGEAKLVLGELGNTYAPPNPWVLSRDGLDLTITIDWNSFSEALLTSPGVELEDSKHFHYTPLAVEAIVFSQAVLGQLLPSAFNSGTFSSSRSDFNLSVEHMSNVIVSCTVWPSQPSLSNFNTAQGILTVSYQPSTRSFVFPSDLKPTIIKTSNTHEKETDKQESILEVFQFLGAHYETKMKSLLKHPRSIKVRFNSEMFEEFGCFREEQLMKRKSDLYYALASTVLSDLFDVLKLILVPKLSPRALRLEQNVTRGIEISLNCCKSVTDEQSVLDACYSDQSILFIEVLLPSGEFSIENCKLCELSFRRNAMEKIRASFLQKHLFTAQNDSIIKVEKFVSAMLKSHLSLPDAPAVAVSADLADMIGKSITLEKVDIELMPSYVLYIRYISRLQIYMKLFCRMLNHSKQVLETSAGMRTFFENKFYIKLSGGGSSDSDHFTFNGCNSQLDISIESLQTKRSLQRSVVCAFRSFITSVPSLALCSSDVVSSEVRLVPSTIPAPPACYVDYAQSLGLLYPVQGKAGIITVLLVDCYGDRIKGSPENLSLQVRIKNLRFGSVEWSSSDVGADRRLADVVESDGTVKIKWIPCHTGLHLVSVRINGMSIRDSPHRCYSQLKSFKLTGEFQNIGASRRAVFVVRHLSECHMVRKPLPVKIYRDTCSSRDAISKDLMATPHPIHHISMCSAYGGSRNWSRVIHNNVAIHVSNNSHKNTGQNRSCLSTILLGSGLYRIELSTIAGSFSVFASCTCCHSVMEILWKGKWSILPSLFCFGV